jgi:hypothetical protein
MNLTMSLSNPQTSTNRLRDLFLKLEQGQPLAVRLAGNSTAGQACFSDDPRSTWGFNVLGHPQKPACSNAFFSNYVTLLVTQITGAYLNVFGISSKDAETSFMRIFSCENMKAVPSSKKSDATLTSCIIWPSDLPWRPQAERTSLVQTTVADIEPTIQGEVPDHLEPATFGWTRSGFKARAAARLFSENVHGDY